MKIRIKKVDRDGGVLSCVRPDGSSTSYRPTDNSREFFAIHDLTHFAVESELPELAGFFSLIADGWDIGDFENTKQTGREIPVQTQLVEFIVGQFDMERASQTSWTDTQFNDYIQTWLRSSQLPDSGFRLTTDQLTRIREHRDQLINQWRDIATGEALELTFQAVRT